MTNGKFHSNDFVESKTKTTFIPIKQLDRKSINEILQESMFSDPWNPLYEEPRWSRKEKELLYDFCFDYVELEEEKQEIEDIRPLTKKEKLRYKLKQKLLNKKNVK